MKRGLTLSDEQINLRSSRRRTHYLLRNFHSFRHSYDERGYFERGNEWNRMGWTKWNLDYINNFPLHRYRNWLAPLQ